MKQYKARDKITQKMSCDGAIEVNAATGKQKRISKRAREAALLKTPEQQAAQDAQAAQPIPGSPAPDISGAGLPGMGCAACASCAACCSGVFSKAASRARLLIRFCFPVAAFTSIAPSQLIFCVILSRALYCFMVVHLQTAPQEGARLIK